MLYKNATRWPFPMSGVPREPYFGNQPLMDFSRRQPTAQPFTGPPTEAQLMALQHLGHISEEQKPAVLPQTPPRGGPMAYAASPGGTRRLPSAGARRRHKSMFATGYAGAIATLAVAMLLGGSSHSSLVIPVSVAGACAVAVMAAWGLRNVSGNGATRRSSGLRAGLLAQLTPVICLSVAYPMAGRQLREDHVGSVQLAALVLAASLITPWLSQIACAPLFMALSAPPADGEPPMLGARWLARWPLAAVSSLPVAAVFGLGVGLDLRWPMAAISALIVLCALNSLFSQSMVVGILQRNYLPWATAWLAFALALVIFPRLWFLPPVAALCTQLGWLLAGRPGFVRPALMRAIPAQFAKGALVGGVLWSDKLFFFLKTTPRFHAEFVFFGVLPAIVTYGYYFVRLAPHLDEIVADMRETMANDAVAVSVAKLRRLSDRVEQSIVEVACVGAILCLLGVIAICCAVPAESQLYGAMAVASTIFMFTTVLLYLLDYVGRVRLVYAYSGMQLLLGALIIFSRPAGVLTYVLLAALSAGLAASVTRRVLDAWRLPEYSLFWRYATEW